MKTVGKIEAWDNLEVRRVKAIDAPELIRLRSLLLNGVDGYYSTDDPEEQRRWQHQFIDWVASTCHVNEQICLAIVDAPDGTSAVACGIGIIDQRPPGPGLITSRCGWIQSVVTDPVWRRRGLAGQVMSFLTDWFVSQEVSRILLHTTNEGSKLYHKHGFNPCGEEGLIATLNQDNVATHDL